MNKSTHEGWTQCENYGVSIVVVAESPASNLRCHGRVEELSGGPGETVLSKPGIQDDPPELVGIATTSRALATLPGTVDR